MSDLNAADSWVKNLALSFTQICYPWHMFFSGSLMLLAARVVRGDRPLGHMETSVEWGRHGAQNARE
jgi:hypothetical protein